MHAALLSLLLLSALVVVGSRQIVEDSNVLNPDSFTSASPKVEVVKLNIGGTIYWTTRTTLLSSGSPFFKALLDEANSKKIVRDEDGFIFIDQEGKNFQLLLNYLRTKKLQDQSYNLRELTTEAKRYSVPLLDGLSALTLAETYHTMRSDDYQQFVANHGAALGRLFDAALPYFLHLVKRHTDPFSSQPTFYVAKNTAAERKALEAAGTICIEDRCVLKDPEIVDLLCSTNPPGQPTSKGIKPEHLQRYFSEKGCTLQNGYHTWTSQCGMGYAGITLSLPQALQQGYTLP